MNISVKHRNALDMIIKWCVEHDTKEFAAGRIQSIAVNRAMQGLYIRGFIYKIGKETYLTPNRRKRIRTLWALTPQGIKSKAKS